MENSKNHKIIEKCNNRCFAPPRQLNWQTLVYTKGEKGPEFRATDRAAIRQGLVTRCSIDV